MLPWPQRASICSGLLLAVEHLHSLDIIHSNVKSANVLLDKHLNPKLAHPVPHPRPDNKKTKYTVMKTHLFQASAAYLPENFVRVGQLTKRWTSSAVELYWLRSSPASLRWTRTAVQFT